MTIDDSSKCAQEFEQLNGNRAQERLDLLESLHNASDLKMRNVSDPKLKRSHEKGNINPLLIFLFETLCQ